MPVNVAFGQKAGGALARYTGRVRSMPAQKQIGAGPNLAIIDHSSGDIIEAHRRHPQ